MESAPAGTGGPGAGRPLAERGATGVPVPGAHRV